MSKRKELSDFERGITVGCQISGKSIRAIAVAVVVNRLIITATDKYMCFREEEEDYGSWLQTFSSP